MLVMRELEGRDERLTDDLITSRLEKVPVMVATTYETILKSPLPPKAFWQSDLWRIIRWLMCTQRVLTVPELEHDLCLELGISR